MRKNLLYSLKITLRKALNDSLCGNTLKWSCDINNVILTVHYSKLSFISWGRKTDILMAGIKREHIAANTWRCSADKCPAILMSRTHVQTRFLRTAYIVQELIPYFMLVNSGGKATYSYQLWVRILIWSLSIIYQAFEALQIFFSW